MNIVAKQRSNLLSKTVDGTSSLGFHAMREPTEWRMPYGQELAGENPDHREDFEHLLKSAVKGQKEA